MQNRSLVKYLCRLPIALLLAAACHCHAQLGTNGWNFKMTNFVIGAWAGPSISEAEIKAYAAANFNTVMVGRYMDVEGAVEGWYTDPLHVQQGLDFAQKYGLGVFIDCYTQNGHPWGGLPVSSGGGQHAFNLEEFQWVHARWGQHPAMVGYLLGDDQGSVDGRMTAIAAYMRTTCPQLFPWISGFCTGPTLYYNGVPSSSQEIYPTLYSWGNSADQHVHDYCDAYFYYGRSLQSYGLPFWPMPNICGSDSLNRFPAYASLAFGSKGVLYFCYAYGCFQQSGPFWTDAAVQAAQTPQYAVGKEMNRRLASWSAWAMDRTSSGLFGTLPIRCSGVTAPATNKLVAAMSDRLLVGVLTKPGTNPVVMVVNALTSKNLNDLPQRTVTIQFHPQVTGINIIENGVSTHTNGNVVTFSIDPGSGQLLELEGAQLYQLSAAAAIYGAALPGLTWDANPGSAGVQEGGGTWDMASANWYAGGTNTVWNNALYSMPLSAIIGGGSGAAGTITVSGTLNADYLTFNPPGSGNYTLTGGALNMVCGGTIVANADATINSPITSGYLPLVKGGSATLILGGTNSLGNGAILNQGVTVSQGTLQLNNSSAAGSGTITLGDTATGTNGVSLFANVAGATFANAILVSTNGTGPATVGGSQDALTLSGPVTLSRAATLGGTASAGYGVSGQISGNAGTLTIDAPSVTFSQAAQNTFSGYVVVNAGRILQLNTRYGLSASNAVTANGTLRVTPGAGNSVTIGALSGSGAVDAYSAGGNSSVTLAFGGDNASGSFGGTISNGAGGDTLSLAKIGSGVQVLTGPLTHTGSTAVNAGTLALTGPASLPGSALISVASGATLDVSGLAGTFALGMNQTLGGSGVVTGGVAAVNGAVLAPATGGVPGTLNLKNNLALTNATLAFDLASSTTAGSGVNDLIQLSGGTLTLAGTNWISLKFLNGSPAGTYTLIQGAGTIIGGPANFALANSVRPGWSVSFDTTSVAGTVLMTISGAAAPVVWRGTNGNVWNFATTNWARAGAADRYWDSDPVVFDDSAATGMVSVATTVAPASVIVSNAALNYTLSGSAIASGGLAKRGPGTLTLTGANSYPGGTTLSQGLLVANHASALGAATSVLTLGEAGAGAGPVEFKVDVGVASAVTLAALNTTGFPTSQTITLNAGAALGFNQPELTIGTLNLNGSVPLTIKATNTGGHGTAQDIVYGLAGSGIAAGSTALTLDGTAASLRTSAPASGAPNSFTGDVLIKGTVTTQGRTYLGQTPDNQNLGFLNNSVTVAAGATWTIVWGGETVASLNGSGNVSLNNQNALNGVGLTVGSANGSGAFSGAISGGFGLAKIGGGTQTLSGAGIAYGGNTSVSGGTLKLVETSLGGASVTITPGAFLELNNSGAWNITPLLTGGGGLVKSGTGTVTLGGTSFSGPTSVNGGILNISDFFGPSAALTVNSGGTLAGSGRIRGALTVNNGGALNVPSGSPFAFPSVNFGSGASALNLTGDATGIPGNLVATGSSGLTNLGTVTVNVSGTLPAAVPGIYTLVSYSGARGGAGGFALGTLPGHMAGYITDTGSAIQLVITNLDPQAVWWAGSPANNWDLSGGLVWRRASDGSPAPFTNGATALFDDRASNFLVNVAASVQPDIVTVTATNDYTFQGAPVSAATAFLKSGPGRLTLLNSNSVPSVALWGGTLQLGNGGTNGWLTVSGSVGLSNNATLAFLRSDSLTLPNELEGAGGLLKLGTNTLSLAGTNTYSGATVLAGGELLVGGAANLPFGSAVTLSNAATLTASSGMTLANTVSLAAGQNGTLKNTSGGNVICTGDFSGVAGTLTLDCTSANGSYFTFNSASGPALGSVVNFAPALSSSQVIVYNTAYQAFLANTRLTVLAGAASGYVLAIGNGSSGLNVQVGAIDGGNANSQVSSDNRASTLTLTGTADGDFAGRIIDGAGSGPQITLVKTGPGTQTLSGANAYTGATTVSNGTLRVNGSLGSGAALTVAGGTLGGSGSIGRSVTVQSGGTLAPGTTNLGTLTIASALTLNPGGTNLMRLYKSGLTRTNDRVAGLSSVTYGGTLALVPIAGSAPFTNGDSFALFNAAGYSGAFAALNLPLLAPGLKWATNNLAVNGTIAVTYSNAVTTPVISPPGGVYPAAQSVTIATDPGATILYTTDGSTPGPSSLVYTGPITVPGNTVSLTIKAYATKAGFADSLVVGATYSTVPTRTWTNPLGGSWTNPANWTNSLVADGSGVAADFSALDLTADATVTLDGARTIGALLFGDTAPSHNWILNPGTGGPITLEAGYRPSIMVNNQTATIGAVLAGTNGLVKSGPGTLVLGVANTLTGPATISQGTLSLNAASALPSAANVILGDTNSAATAPTLGVTFATTLSSLTVPAGVSNATLYTTPNGTVFATFTNVVLNSPLTISKANTGGNWQGVQTVGGGRMTGPGAGPGKDTLLLLNAGGAQAYIQANNVANDFLGNVHVVTGDWRIQNGGGANLTIPDTASVTVDTGAVLYFSTAGLPESIDGLNGGGTLSRNVNETNALTVGASGGSGSFSGVIQNGNGTFALIKTGPGVQILSCANTYTGPTTISNGVLAVNGSLAAGSPVTVAGGVLAGTGTVRGPVTVQSAGTLAPGSGGIGTLTLTNPPALGGQVRMKISKGASPNADQLVIPGQPLTYAGTLTVTNLGPLPLAAGDVFTLFNAASYTGAFAITNLPVLASGLGWVWTPTNGTLAVVATVATNPTNLVASVSGGQLTLSWPPDHSGWTLQSQTNSLAAGLSALWYDLPGSTSTNQMTFPLDVTKPTVFYRLKL
jgi:autotransporter-associated beta strand protein